MSALPSVNLISVCFELVSSYTMTCIFSFCPQKMAQVFYKTLLHSVVVCLIIKLSMATYGYPYLPHHSSQLFDMPLKEVVVWCVGTLKIFHHLVLYNQLKTILLILATSGLKNFQTPAIFSLHLQSTSA